MLFPKIVYGAFNKGGCEKQSLEQEQLLPKEMA
jgi:hypothetical protein